MRTGATLTLLLTFALLALASDAWRTCTSHVDAPWSSACTSSNCQERCREGNEGVPCRKGDNCFWKSRCVVHGCECTYCEDINDRPRPSTSASAAVVVPEIIGVVDDGH